MLGRIATALTPKPQMTPESQATRAWKIGAEGERRVAEILDGLTGLAVLHDRLMPGSRSANIDHVVIGPAGVFVIHAKKYEGTLEVRDIGSMFRPDERLFVAGRNKTALVDGVRKQVDAVRSVLAADHGDVPVMGVLCFIGCVWTKGARSTSMASPWCGPTHSLRTSPQPVRSATAWGQSRRCFAANCGCPEHLRDRPLGVASSSTASSVRFAGRPHRGQRLPCKARLS